MQLAKPKTDGAIAVVRGLLGNHRPEQVAKGEYKMSGKQAMTEHLRLLQVLASESHTDDHEELARQARELPEIEEAVSKGEPTKAQIAAGNYPMEHRRMHGLDISIENPAGTTRRGVDGTGKAWEMVLPYDYGYIKRTEGADGDHLDVAIGPIGEDGTEAHIFNQRNPQTGEFDEHKVFIGYPNRESAIQAFKNGRSDDPNKVMGEVVTISIDALKQWIKDGCLEEEAVLKAETTHVTSHYRTVNGHVTYIHEHERAIEHPVAGLHERTVADVNRAGMPYIRATNAADRDKVLEAAQHVGATPQSQRQSGANHHGRQGAYPHVYFSSQEETQQVMAELRRRHAPATPEQAEEHAAENLRIIGEARDFMAEAQESEGDGQYIAAANAWDRAAERWTQRAESPSVNADLRRRAAEQAAECRRRSGTLSEGFRAPDPARAPTPAPVSLQGSGRNYFDTAPAGKLTRRVWMENTTPGHNKMYCMDIRQVSDDGYVVNVAFGSLEARRAKTLQTKTPQVVSLAQANRVVHNIAMQKQGRGYETKEDGPGGRIGFTPLDYYRHPSITSDALLTAVRQANAAQGGYADPTVARPAAPAAPATPAPAPARPAAPTPTPGVTASQYEALRATAFSAGNTARNTENQYTADAFRNSMNAYRTHTTAKTGAEALGITTGSDRGTAWHKDRATHWLAKAKSQWSTALASSMAANTSGSVASATRSGVGFEGAIRSMESALAIAGERPAGTPLPSGLTESEFETWKINAPKTIKMLRVGQELEAMPAAKNSETRARKTADIIKTAIAGGWTEGTTDQARTLAGHFSHAATIIENAKATLANHDATPEALRGASAGIKTSVQAINTAMEALPATALWKHAVTKTITGIKETATTITADADRRAAMPRVSDHRYASQHERARTAAEAAHRAAGTDRGKMVRALEAHKLAAVSTHHAALAAIGEERAKLMAKAQEHAQHARDFVAKLNRR